MKILWHRTRDSHWGLITKEILPRELDKTVYVNFYRLTTNNRLLYYALRINK